MSVKIDRALPSYVVEIGNEVSQNAIDGLMSASPSASSANPYVTQELLDGKLSLTGGTLTGALNVEGSNPQTAYLFEGDLFLHDYEVNSSARLFTGSSQAFLELKSHGNNDGFDYLRTANFNPEGINSSWDDGNNESNWGINTSGISFGYTDNYVSLSQSGWNSSGNGGSPLLKFNNLKVGVVSGNGFDPWEFGYAGATFGDGTVQTTAATTPTFATTAEAKAGTSTTIVVSPATLLDAKYFQGGRNISQVTWVAGGSGSGATSSFVQNRRDVSAPTTVVGAGWWYAFLSNASRGSSVTSSFNWAKRVVFGARLNRNVASPDANTIFRFSIGKTTQAQGDLIERGIMVKQTAGGALQLLVHNGSTLSTVTSSFTPTYQQAYDLLVVSDGAGNATLYVNDVSVATSTGSPTTAGGINSHQLIYMAENSAVITGSPMNYQISDVFFQNNL